MTAIELAVWGGDADVAKVLLEKPETTILGDDYRSVEDYTLDLMSIASGKRSEPGFELTGQVRRHAKPTFVGAHEEDNYWNDDELEESFDEVVKSLSKATEARAQTKARDDTETQA